MARCHAHQNYKKVRNPIHKHKELLKEKRHKNKERKKKVKHFSDTINYELIPAIYILSAILRIVTLTIGDPSRRWLNTTLITIIYFVNSLMLSIKIETLGLHKKSIYK